jgi:curved DNA-binding protein CbpA
MTIHKLTDHQHALFTRLTDPEGFMEQCDKIINFRTKKLTASKLLGIDNLLTVNVQEIKKSFRLLALRFHPDKAPDKEAAEKAFCILTDAYDYLRYQKKELSRDAIENNIFNQAETIYAAHSFATKFSEEFFADLFDDLDGLNEEQIKQVERLRKAKRSADDASAVIESLTAELDKMGSYDFSNELSTSAVELKKNELLEKVTAISSSSIGSLRNLDPYMLHPEDKKERTTKIGIRIVDLTKRRISNNADFRSFDLKGKENFLQDPYTRLKINWDAIIKKTEELEEEAKRNPNYTEAARKARILVTELETAHLTFLRSTKNDEMLKADFRKSCLDAIEEARTELINHRGWAQVIADFTINLLIFVGTLSISYIVTGKFRLFTPQTDSAKKLQALEDSVRGEIDVPGLFQ